MRVLLGGFLVLVAVSAGLLLWSSNSFNQSSDNMFLTHPMVPDHWKPAAYNPQSLPMTFAHADHAEQQCVACHHNYQDDTGQGLCLDCHRNDQSLAFKVHDQFHQLCMGCHTDLRSEDKPSGPLRNCKACHTQDQAP